MRCGAAVERYFSEKRRGNKPILIATAGMAPCEAPLQAMVMGRMMGTYCAELGISVEDIRTGEDASIWDSRKEIREALRIIKSEANGFTLLVIVVSSWYHIPRLMWIVWTENRSAECRIFRRKNRIKYIPTEGGSFTNIIFEPLKIVADMSCLTSFLHRRGYYLMGRRIVRRSR